MEEGNNVTSQRILPYPDWNYQFAEELEGVPIVDMKLVATPRRHYCVTFENGIRLAFADSPSKVVGATEDKPGLCWWSAGLAADFLLDNIGQLAMDANLSVHGSSGNVLSVAFPEEKRDAWYALARKQHDVQKREAAKTGSSVHEFIETTLKRMVEGVLPLPSPPDMDPKVFAGIKAFEKWWQEHGYHAEGVEVPICHPHLGYAGTIDVVAIDSMGVPLLIDWKTAKSLHASNYSQLGAYWLAYNHTHPEEPIDHAHLVRLGKEGETAGQFETIHLTWADLEEAAQAFTDALCLYRYQCKINERLKRHAKG